MKYFYVGILLVIGQFASYAQGLSGRITDANTGKGIPEVKVTILGVQLGTYTDSNGYFIISESLPDHMDIKVSAELYETKVVHVLHEEEINLLLKPSHLEMEDVVLIMPSGKMERDNTIRVERVSIKDLNAIASSNLTEAIANINGVQISSSGVGIAKPVIRGLQGVRVLTVLNGMRVENQQWGGDHGLGISQLGLGAVEVIKGPSSLLYGADAFGGVLYLADEKFAGLERYNISASSQFETVNLGTNNTLDFKIAHKRMRLNIAGLYSSYADYQMANGKYLAESRFRDNGVKMRFGVNKNNWSMQLRYLYSKSRIGIPGHTHDSILDPNKFQIDEQSRAKSIPAQDISNHFVSVDNKFYFVHNVLHLMLGHTYNDLAEFEEKHTIPGLRMKLNNSLYHLRFDAQINENWKIISGLQGMYQVNSNDLGAEETLIPNYTQLDNGLYSIAYWTSHRGLSFQTGLRYDIRNLKSVDFAKTYTSPNFSIGGMHRADHDGMSNSSFRLNVSSGFRAPHVSELLVEGQHHGALRYEIGNSDLKSERATQFDFDYQFESEHLLFVLNPFYNYVMNYTQIQQLDSVVEALPVYVYEQFDRAHLYGVDLGVHYHPHFAHWLHFESSYSYIRGESLSGANMTLMPQARINNFLKINFKNSGSFKFKGLVLQHQYFFEQNRISGLESHSPAYNVVNIGANFHWDMTLPIDISVGAKNLLNERYVNHLSRLKNIGATEPGRNIYVKLTLNLSGSLKNKQL